MENFKRMLCFFYVKKNFDFINRYFLKIELLLKLSCTDLKCNIFEVSTADEKPLTKLAMTNLSVAYKAAK